MYIKSILQFVNRAYFKTNMLDCAMAENFLLFLMLFFGMNICSSSGNPSEVLCIESESEALLRFKKGLVDRSNRVSSWDVEQDCCKWVGINCDNSTR